MTRVYWNRRENVNIRRWRGRQWPRPPGLEQGHLILLSNGNVLMVFKLENGGICFGIFIAHSDCLILWGVDFRGSRVEA